MQSVEFVVPQILDREDGVIIINDTMVVVGEGMTPVEVATRCAEVYADQGYNVVQEGTVLSFHADPSPNYTIEMGGPRHRPGPCSRTEARLRAQLGGLEEPTGRRGGPGFPGTVQRRRQANKRARKVRQAQRRRQR